MIKPFTHKIRALLILLFMTVMPLAHALPTETEYLGTVVHSGYIDDAFWGPLPIGFSFDFFGNTYTNFYVTSNGLVMFGSGSTQYWNDDIPTGGWWSPNNYIAPFWDDLVVHSTGDIMYKTIGTAPNRKLVIQYSNMSFWSSPVLFGTIQVILYEGSNKIQMQYRSIVDLSSDRASGNSATIGLENLNGSAGVQCSYNTAGYIYSGRAILFEPSGSTYTYDDNALYDGVLLVDVIPRAGTPALVSPAYNSTIGDTVNFQWEAASNASSYFVVISQNSDLSSPIHTSADLTTLSYEYILSPDQTYYWSAYAKNSEGTISWSEIWRFRTSSTPPLFAIPQTMYLEQGNSRTLPLLFTGGDAGSKTATVTSLPAQGALYQYNGGVPGALITTVPTDVTDASFHLIYSASGTAGNGVGNFNFHFTDVTGTSADATYTINVSPPGVPNFMYASKEIDRVEITFDRNMADPTGKHLEFAVQDNGVNVTSISCALKAGDPTTIVVYVSPNLDTDHAIAVSYTKGTVTAESTGALESFDFQLAGKLAQVINFSALADRTYGEADFTLSATASSGLPVTFSSSNSTVVSVSGTSASVHNAGETLISASQTGDATYAAVSFERHQLVNKATASVTLSNLSQEYTGSGIGATATTVPSGLTLKVTYDGIAALPVDLGTYTVLAEVEEANYDGSATDLLVISDLTPPVPDLATLPDLNGECSVTPIAPTATDFYAGSITGTTVTPFPVTAQGTTVVTWTYEDGNGNSFTQDQNVILDDVTAPVPDVDPLGDVTAECEVTTLTAPTATDNCAGTVTGTHNATLPITTQGTTVVTWSFEDGNGNTSTQLQNVILDDVTAPVPNVDPLGDVTAECEVTTLTAPTATDNCAGAVTGTHNATLPITTQGTTVVTWTYEDGNGNTSTQLQNVIIADINPPVPDVASLPDITTECEVITLTAPTATDNCAGTVTGTHNATLPITTQGTTIVTWTYEDGNGNTSTQLQNVIIADINPPVPDVASLPDITAECEVTTLTAPTATDNCAGTVTGTHNATLPITTQGTTVVTWTYDDGNGNTSTQLQNVILDDVTNPDTPVMADVTGECTATAVAPTTTDNCAGTITGTTTDPLTYSAQGSYVITWTFDDGNGNSINAYQNVMVADVTAPTATAPEDMITCDGTVSAIGLTNVLDNCSTPDITYSLNGATTGSGSGDASSVLFDPGVTTVTYTLDDGNGNSSQYQFTVTYQVVEDIVVTATDGKLTCENTGSYLWINCNDNSIVEGETSASFSPVTNGEYAVILTQGACSDTSECYSVTASGIGNGEVNRQYVVYPNPAHDFVTIDMVDEQTNATIKVVDMTGKILRMVEMDRFIKTNIDISSFKEGLYLIQIHSDQVNRVARVIKE
jgi:carbon monoxide dehydrogenase subunit G